MNKRYSLVVIMILLSLLLGGCSLMTDQSTEKQEMIQIAESQKMKVAIESYLKNLDPEALTPNGKIKTYRILKDKLKYNPMEGINIEIVINNDDKLIVDMVVIEKESGLYHVAASSTPTELDELLEGKNYGQ
mgnify:FL=1